MHPVVGRRLPTQRYELGPDRKYVDYWAMTPADGTFVATDEVDSLRWVTPAVAATTLTYDRDRQLVATLRGRCRCRPRWCCWCGTPRPAAGRGGRARTRSGRWTPAAAPRPKGCGRRCAGSARPRSARPTWCAASRPWPALAEDLGLPVGSEPALSEEAYGKEPAAALDRGAGRRRGRRGHRAVQPGRGDPGPGRHAGRSGTGSRWAGGPAARSRPARRAPGHCPSWTRGWSPPTTTRTSPWPPKLTP